LRALDHLAFEIGVQLAQSGFGGPQRLLRTMSIGDVNSFDKNRGDGADLVPNGLVDEVQIPRFGRTSGRTLQGDLYVFSNERLAGGVDAIEQVDKALAFGFGHGLANRQADDIAMPDELLVGGIGQHEPMVGPLKERREARRLGKHLLEPANLLASIE
jgi:hypothetical protein